MVCVKLTMAKHFKLIEEEVVTWVVLREKFPFMHVKCGGMGTVIWG